MDLPRAEHFYTTLFGWDFGRPKDMGLPDDGTYALFSKKGTAAMGGLQLVSEAELIRPGATQQTVRITMTVESIDESLKVAEKEGGKVVL